jgi:hypothetical protein
MKKFEQTRFWLSVALLLAFTGIAFSQSVTFNVSGTNPRCQSTYPNGAPYSGVAIPPGEYQSLVDVTFQLQISNSGSWTGLWGGSFTRVGSGAYSNNSLGATQLTLTPTNLIRMRAIIRYRVFGNPAILTSVAFSPSVQYNYFPAPSPDYTINGETVYPNFATNVYMCVSGPTLAFTGLSSIMGTGIMWSLVSYFSNSNGDQGSQLSSPTCG